MDVDALLQSHGEEAPSGEASLTMLLPAKGSTLLALLEGPGEAIPTLTVTAFCASAEVVLEMEMALLISMSSSESSSSEL